jgi:formylglycine-generating enzyme required for sulfatase activity
MGNADTNEFGEWWYAREVPVHEVEVGAFYIDRYEVSNERMRQAMQWAFEQGLLLAGPNGITNAVGDPQELLSLDDAAAEISFDSGIFSVEAGLDNFPCVMVSWYGAMAYCSYNNQAQGLGDSIDMTDWSCDFAANGYRLPTEAEWEKAARGGLVDHYFPWEGSGGSWSNHIDGTKANYESSNDGYDNGATPLAYYNGSQRPVGSDMANGYGLYDMAGNVYEWCWDWYSGSWYSKAGATTADTAGPPSGGSRLLRGGAWYRTPEFLRCSFRHFSNPDFSYHAFGFRCARSTGN